MSFLLPDWDLDMYKLKQHPEVVIENRIVNLGIEKHFRNFARISLTIINEPLSES